LLDARLQFCPDAQRPQAQSTQTYAEVSSDALTQINLCSLVLRVISLDDLSRVWSEVL